LESTHVDFRPTVPLGEDAVPRSYTTFTMYHKEIGHFLLKENVAAKKDVGKEDIHVVKTGHNFIKQKPL
jgi:hypothetical protein